MQTELLPINCSKCNDTGWIDIVVYGQNRVTHCNCQLIRIRKELLGERFYNIKLNEIVPRNKQQALLIDTFRGNDSQSYYIYGKSGQGKSHILSGIFNYLFDKNLFTVKYFSASELKKILTDEMFKRIEIISDDILSGKIKTIFIEDFEYIKLTDTARELFFDFINDCYRAKTQLIITSNKSLIELKDNWDEALLRRLDDMCLSFEI